MAKLSATDASFIYAETAQCPMSIASVQIFEMPPNVSVDDFVASLRTFIHQRRHLVPYLTRRVQWDRGWLGHPNWIEDEHFDIDHHIYKVSVPAPGGMKELEQITARLHETPLDRSRPLWDIVVLEGLQDGRIAYYNRAHHACLDGVAAQASTQILMDETPSPTQLKPAIPAEPTAPQAFSGHLTELLTQMTEQSWRAAVNAPRRANAAFKLWQRAINPSQGLGAAVQAGPSTRFNQNIDKGRTVAFTELPLAGIKQIGKRSGMSINDVFLSLCGGALRRYLARHQELPERPLIAACPVSLRQSDDVQANNQVTMMQVALGSDIEDPVERLLAVHQSADVAKGVIADSVDLIPSDFVAPGLGAGIRALSEAAGRLPIHLASPMANVVISNVPGPRRTLYSNGARMLTHYPVSIPAQGQALNITVQSYDGQLFVGFTACAKRVPDVDRLRDDLLAEYERLNTALSADVVELVGTTPSTDNADTAVSTAPAGTTMPSASDKEVA